MTTIDEAAAAFRDELLAKSPRTLKTYSAALRSFRLFLVALKIDPATAPVTDLREDLVRQFLLSLYREPVRYREPSKAEKAHPGAVRRSAEPFAERTVRTYVTAVNRFYNFLARQEYTTPNLEMVREKLRATRRRYSPSIPFIGTETIEKIIDHVKTRPAQTDPKREVKRKRDIALVVVLARTGLRLSEVCNLQRRDIRPDDGLLLVRGGKGGKDRVVDINPEVLNVLRAYWQAADSGRVPHDTRPLADLPAVAGHDKRSPLLQPISPKTVERIVEGYVNDLGISEHVTPHSFRHGFATVLVENDVNLLLVKELLGHANISTTQVYAHLSDRDRRNAYQRVFGKWGQTDPPTNQPGHEEPTEYEKEAAQATPAPPADHGSRPTAHGSPDIK
ncbi:MAG: tyrosine-type recombinase/integrase [Chloroflexota bacterium]|nr:tyrosine-type recombinase/integrase [Chloroflexota bacterium]